MIEEQNVDIIKYGSEEYFIAFEKKYKDSIEKKYIKQSGKKSLLRMIYEESNGISKLRTNAVLKEAPS